MHMFTHGASPLFFVDQEYIPGTEEFRASKDRPDEKKGGNKQ